MVFSGGCLDRQLERQTGPSCRLVSELVGYRFEDFVRRRYRSQT